MAMGVVYMGLFIQEQEQGLTERQSALPAIIDSP